MISLIFKTRWAINPCSTLSCQIFFFFGGKSVFQESLLASVSMLTSQEKTFPGSLEAYQVLDYTFTNNFLTDFRPLYHLKRKNCAVGEIFLSSVIAEPYIVNWHHSFCNCTNYINFVGLIVFFNKTLKLLKSYFQHHKQRNACCINGAKSKNFSKILASKLQ